MIWVIKAKRRKSKEVVILSRLFDDFIFAKTAFSALKAGFGMKYINKTFTYFQIEKLC
ncbi:hypothetical protein HZC35_07190 [Candidatus Saganbacteria bacterium]|nr:hypothetical protein [Candidatus Saganbacteria bacterium]